MTRDVTVYLCWVFEAFGLLGQSSLLLLHLGSQLVQLAFEAGQLCLRFHRGIDVDLRYGRLRLGGRVQHARCMAQIGKAIMQRT